ncbi:TetR/AcrR family transcriptional regulator [Paracoccus spongiarum]|uniref:TetR/AcrR family transcriptional regulator n=1 Tax=Paracoccus spongiarum TaxID=3064387 RepID=A0ABT9J8Z7_9RHOB|nr:TetR/AcrR family transcriptional regulator [Paracoccus sp. 2205BS29-5]MDP5306282.1 TetR/AcrR family transcriptional regulator [Paracoccus sp. 2205BS29-5]
MDSRTKEKSVGDWTEAEDARIARTRARLAEAVLSLAAERDITSASVSELTRRAGINRSTFYEHAQTPVELLTRVLSCELDGVRRRGMDQLERDGLLLRDLTRSTLHEIFEHVLKHEAVYGGAGRASSKYALRVVLAEHIEQSILTMLREGFVTPPVPGPEAAPLYAAYLAHGATGAVEAWLRLPPPRDEGMLLAAIEAMYPSWLAPDIALSDCEPGMNALQGTEK